MPYDDEEDPCPTRVYVGGLSERITKEDLEDEFGKSGTLANVWVASNPPGFAFIQFEDAGDADRAVDALDGQNLLGSTLKVQIARGRKRGRGGRGNWENRGGYGSRGGGGYNNSGGGSRSYGGGGGGGGGSNYGSGGGFSRGRGRGGYRGRGGDSGYGGYESRDSYRSYGGDYNGTSSQYRSRSPMA